MEDRVPIDLIDSYFVGLLLTFRRTFYDY